MLLTIVVSLLVGFILGLGAGLVGLGETQISLLGSIVGGAIGLFFSIQILKSVPEKEFSDFTVVLLKRESEAKQNEN